MTKLSVVIPVFNGELFLENTVNRFLQMEDVSFQIILVDDASDDGTPDIIASLVGKHGCIEAIRCDENRGAGVARNVGFERVEGEYVIFFDVDDVIHPQALVNMITLAESTDCDCLIAAYDLATEFDKQPIQMHGVDQQTWNKLLEGRDYNVLDSRKSGRLCSITNYPWNKIIKTDFAKRIGLRFGETAVHNDILGHWYITALAQTITLSCEILCTHIVPESGKNITNIQDERRLQIFDALQSVDDLLNLHPETRKRNIHHLGSGPIN